jgi:penicillin-binding protein A
MMTGPERDRDSKASDLVGPVRKVAIACLVLFAALMLNANWIQVGDASSLKHKPTNARAVNQRLERQRGSITAGGQSIALSVPSDDQFKFQRQYPYKSMYANVTGYYALVNETGLERSQDSFLAGDDNRLFVSRLSGLISGHKQRGGTVVTTIVPALQQVATTALAGRRGAVVALDPSTGAILAMVTAPSFDPNTLASHSGTTVNANAAALNANPDMPLLNRALQQTYPPGSTFKLVTAAAALSSGNFTPSSEIPSPTVLQLPQSNTPLTNFGGEQCGDGVTTTLTDALRISCNTAFGQLGMDVGANALQAQAEKFGLNSTVTGFPLPMARSVFPAGLEQDKAHTAQSAIGQFDVRVTPLQMAEVTAAIADNGTLMKPYLVDRYITPDLKVVSRTSPTKLSQPVSSDVAAQLNQMMQAVVTSGTGTAAQIPGVTVAGKTGTAQHGNGLAPHAWFVGFAPAENPKVAVAVVVEDGGGELAATGGAVAAPIAQQVMAKALEVQK